MRSEEQKSEVMVSAVVRRDEQQQVAQVANNQLSVCTPSIPFRALKPSLVGSQAHNRQGAASMMRFPQRVRAQDFRGWCQGSGQVLATYFLASSCSSRSFCTLRFNRGIPAKMEMSVMPTATTTEIQAFLPSGVFCQLYCRPPLLVNHVRGASAKSKTRLQRQFRIATYFQFQL